MLKRNKLQLMRGWLFHQWNIMPHLRDPVQILQHSQSMPFVRRWILPEWKRMRQMPYWMPHVLIKYQMPDLQ
jgi:hypothetical protein